MQPYRHFLTALEIPIVSVSCKTWIQPGFEDLYLCFLVCFQPIGGTEVDRFKCNMICFSTFLELSSEANNLMQSQEEIQLLYQPCPWDPEVSSSNKPILHVGYIEHVLCRAPLIPCFLDGNSTNTIPHSKRSESRNFPNGKCDSQPGAGNTGLVYPLNMLLWRFGRGKSRRISVEDAAKEHSERIEEGRRQAAATKKARKT